MAHILGTGRLPGLWARRPGDGAVCPSAIRPLARTPALLLGARPAAQHLLWSVSVCLCVCQELTGSRLSKREREPV